MKLALIGDPVAHSRSPEIFARLFAEAKIEGSYDLIRVAKGGAKEAILDLRERGYNGLNVTTPLKEEAAAACDELTPTAEEICAVNAIAFRDGRIVGTNIDGIGALRALEAHMGPVAGLAVLVLGTGPAARAALAALRNAGAQCFLWGRNSAKVTEVGAHLRISRWENQEVETVISALPPGAAVPAALTTVMRSTSLVMDCNYGERAALLRSLERPVLPGDAMLKHQAASNFAFFCG